MTDPKTPRNPISKSEPTRGGRDGEGRPANRYGILGVNVSLRTDSDEVRSFFAHAYRWFPPVPGVPDLELTAVFSADAPGGIHASANGEHLDLTGSASPENRAFLFLLDKILDRIDGCIMLHGAATSYQGAGIILAGPALAGKSTLVLELMRLGHRFLSDDAAPLERSTGRLLPFPRAIGVRRPVAGEREARAALPREGVLDLPHKWLVDPAALGASLPALACAPSHLFYLAPGPAGGAGDPVARIVEIALAEPDRSVASDLEALCAGPVEEIPGRPFRTLRARLRGGPRSLGDLAALWRRHRRSILYLEEVRPPVRRVSGEPILRPAPTAALLLPLVRDILNRSEEGKLMASHRGMLTSLVYELGKLLRGVRCHEVTSGEPAKTAAALTELIRAEGSQRR